MATQIPKGPWTVETLGEELYCQLALEYGCFDPSKDMDRPAIDLTTPYNEQQAGTPAKTAPAAKAGKE